MTRKKTRAKAKKLGQDATNSNGISESLPMTTYFSVVGVHNILWGFVALYLPRTRFLVELKDWDQTPQSSRDRPQHPFVEALTINPTSTLIYIFTGAIVLQFWWAGWLRDWWFKMHLLGSEDEKRTEKALYDRQKSTAFRNAVVMTFLTSLVIHCILVLFGAPITSLVLKTYLLSLLLSLMTVYSPAYSIGVPAWGKNVGVTKTWVRLFAKFSPQYPVERALIYPAVGTVLGSWLGIIPIALDWDRPWQAWPLTPVFGAIGGYIISSLTALTVNGLAQLPR